MRVLKFSKCPIDPHRGESWEKLQDRKVGYLFTTFRAYEWRKHRYYKGLIGQELEVQEQGHSLGRARLLSVKPRLPLELTPEEIGADTFAGIHLQFFYDLLVRFYGMPDVVLLKLSLKWTEVYP